MNRLTVAAVVLCSVGMGSLLYANSQKNVERQNAAYLKAMIEGSYATSNNGCTDEIRLLPSHRYQQNITLADGRTFQASGSWTRPANSPDSLSASNIVLHEALNDGDVCNVPPTATAPAPGWDFTIPARSFHF